MTLTSTALRVRHRSAPPGVYVIDGTFSKPHRMDDATWWIDDKKTLTVQLVKIKRSEWWMNVLVGGKELKWEQIQPEHPTYVEDLDGDTQALVKKMMFDNQQRQRGLPTRYVNATEWPSSWPPLSFAVSASPSSDLP